MCGRYTLAVPDPAVVWARFPIGGTEPGERGPIDVRTRYNVAPGDDVLAVTTDRDGTPRGELLHWGLVPSWADRPDGNLKMINARVETVTERPAYRRAFERFRCLIIADGFYEWTSAGPGRPKHAFHITRSDGELFAFAGLWSVWKGPGGHKLRSCTILTTKPNSVLAPLHDRMPVILEPAGEAPWLDRATDRAALLGLLAGLSARATAVRRVGPAVNDARYDGPECLQDAEPDIQQALL